MIPNQSKANAHSTVKERKGFEEKSLEEIISPALSELNFDCKEAGEYLASLARNGSLEQYQTRGNIKETTEELLRKLRGGNDVENQSS